MSEPAQPTHGEVSNASQIDSQLLREAVTKETTVPVSDDDTALLKLTGTRTQLIPVCEIEYKDGTHEVPPGLLVMIYDQGSGFRTIDMNKKVDKMRAALNEAAAAEAAGAGEPAGKGADALETDAEKEPEPFPESEEGPRPAEIAGDKKKPTPTPKKEAPTLSASDKKSKMKLEELKSKLEESDLEDLAPAFVKAGITSVSKLAKHTISERVAPQRRPHVLGAKFTFSNIDARALLESGLLMAEPEAPPEPPGPPRRRWRPGCRRRPSVRRADGPATSTRSTRA